MRDLEKEAPQNLTIAGMYDACSDTERAFIDNYVTTLSKTKAAKAAGLSHHTASMQGWQIYNRPHMKVLIRKILNARSPTAEEIISLTAKNAHANLADCMVKVKKHHTPYFETPLAEIIDQIEADIYRENIFMKSRTFLPEDIERSKQRIADYVDQIARYEAELMTSPSAYRILPGPTVLVEEDVLDMAKVVEKGLQLKSVQYDKEGKLKVEIVSPEQAQEALRRIHGLYKKDNEQLKPEANIKLKIGYGPRSDD